jgi:single-strand DNA-binding protein
MAGSFNKVFLMGNLTRDVEIKYTQANKAVANVGLAINNRYKAADGTMKEDTTFVDCEAWGQTAESLSKFLSKGRPVFIEGRLRLDTWQDKTDGSNRSKLKVVVETFTFVDSKPEGGGSNDGYAPAQAPVQAAQPRQPVAPVRRVEGNKQQAYTPIVDEDIPFDQART